MEREDRGLFSKVTTIVGIIITLLTVTGFYLAPIDSNLIIIIGSVAIIAVIVFDKFNRLEVVERNVEELNKKINIEQRFHTIEKELSEQRGKLSMVMKK